MGYQHPLAHGYLLFTSQLGDKEIWLYFQLVLDEKWAYGQKKKSIWMLRTS